MQHLNIIPVLFSSETTCLTVYEKKIKREERRWAQCLPHGSLYSSGLSVYVGKKREEMIRKSCHLIRWAWINENKRQFGRRNNFDLTVIITYHRVWDIATGAAYSLMCELFWMKNSLRYLISKKCVVNIHPNVEQIFNLMLICYYIFCCIQTNFVTLSCTRYARLNLIRLKGFWA